MREVDAGHGRAVLRGLGDFPRVVLTALHGVRLRWEFLTAVRENPHSGEQVDRLKSCHLGDFDARKWHAFRR